MKQQAAGSGQQKAATDGRPGEGSPKQPGEAASGSSAQQPSAQQPSAQQPSGQQPSGQQPSGQQPSGKTGVSSSGTPGGGVPGKTSDAAPPEAVESPADQANLDYARRQTTLALEYLRDQLAKEKPEVLQRLGWTKDDARRFLDRWQQMQQSAAQKGEEGKAAQKQLDEALRSLGLRPRGTQLQHGGVTADNKPQNLRDAGRFAPPPDWAEQFREYTRGVADSERK
jgi:hypothetical protein